MSTNLTLRLEPMLLVDNVAGQPIEGPGIGRRTGTLPSVSILNIDRTAARVGNRCARPCVSAIATGGYPDP
jgi:hypothetical protein